MKRLQETLKGTLPSFWRDSFEDQEILNAITYGVSVISSELYTRAMSTVPSLALTDCQLTYRPERMPISIGTDTLVPLEDGRWACSVGQEVKSITALRSKSPEGELSLLVNDDFNVYSQSDLPEAGHFTELYSGSKVLVFQDNPFSWGDTGENIPYSSEYTETVSAAYFLREPLGTNAVYDSIQELDYIYVDDGESYTKCLVALKQEAVEGELEPGLYLYTSTPAPYVGSVRVATTEQGLDSVLTSVSLSSEEVAVEAQNISLVAISPVVDRRRLWDIYGRRFGHSSRESTETYRSELLGLTLLSAGKPSIANFSAAISYLLDLPVAGGVDDIVVSVETLDNGDKIVTTTNSRSEIRSIYDINPKILEYAVVVDGVRGNTENTANILSEKTPVVSTYDLYDYSSSGSSWWATDRLVLEEYMVPHYTEDRATVGDGTAFDNIAGNGLDDCRIGDYTAVIGALTRKKIAYALTRDFYLDKILVVSKPESYTGALLTSSHIYAIKRAAPSWMVILIHKDA